MRISERYADQILKAKRDRNLKSEHHGVLVKSWSIVRTYTTLSGDKIQGLLIVQMPFFDISARDLTVWIRETFPVLKNYISTKAPYHFKTDKIDVTVMYLGPDKYAKKPGLIELHLRINADEYLDDISVEYVQNYLHFAATSEVFE